MQRHGDATQLHGVVYPLVISYGWNVGYLETGISKSCKGESVSWGSELPLRGKVGRGVI